MSRITDDKSNKLKMRLALDPRDNKVKPVKAWQITATDIIGAKTHYIHSEIWDGPIQDYMCDPSYEVKPIF